MSSLRHAQIALWVAYALVMVIHLGSLTLEAGLVQRVTQPLFTPLLIAILLLCSVPRERTTALLTAGLLLAWVGDTLPPFLADAIGPATAVVMFMLSLTMYCAALGPIWARGGEPLRLALAVPYAGVVIGLFVACADGAGEMLPLVGAYAAVLATMAFLSSGGNGLTWMGGTLFLLSSSLLAMDWFLPGAAIMHSQVWVMLTYTLAQAFLVAGMLRIIPSREHAQQRARAGAELVIVEG